MEGGLARLSQEVRDSILIVRLAGDVDVSNAFEVGAAIADMLPADVTGLVLDLSQAGYLDSAGVQMLFELGERLRERRKSFCLAVPDELPLRRTLAVFQIQLVFPVAPTVDEALKADAEPGTD
jgi:anti-anti-sigma factor